ncbi:Serine/threonine-protein kinase ATR [Lamellibrachia satsuma]|nr:Serine/threonine-protein kinase ATR [Lamellibrachia satsuma]
MSRVISLITSFRLSSVTGQVVSLQRLFRHTPMVSLRGEIIAQLLTPSLQLLEDNEYDIRLAFSKTVPYVIGTHGCNDGGSHQVNEVIVTKLKMAVKAARDSSNVSLMETILLTVGELGRVADSDLLLVMVIILLDMLLTPFCPLAAAVAHQQLKEIAQKKKTKLQQLFLQFGRSICKVLVEHLHEAEHEQRVQDIITGVAEAFEFSDAKDFLMRTEHLLLPHLVKKATTTASSLLRTISKHLGDPNHKGPLARNIRHIFCHLVCSCQPDELIRTCTYLEAESEWDLGSLLRFGQNVDSELLLHLGTHYDQVLTGIKILASKSGNYQWPSENITSEHLADMLQSKLLGILVHFDNQLNNGTITAKEKKQTYESLISLIKLMGPRHITTVRVRVMTTLKIGLVFKESGFPELCASAWNCFVRSVDVLALGPMLSQILVSLLPLLRQLPKQVAEIFSYLIVDNRRVLCVHFHELYFLPDVPELTDVNAVLKNYTEGSHSSPDLKTTIEHLLKGISHESVDVRLLALTKLKTLLHNNQESLHQLVLTGETADQVISHTVAALLRGCRTADQNMRSLYGECLGQLGAIDPGRLDFLTSKSTEEVGQFVATVIDNNFATELITELAKAFLRAEDRNTQDCVAFAIQELIQIYGITNDADAASDSDGSRLWQRFSEEVHEIMAPLMHSRYRLTLKYNWSQLVTPIYRSKKGAKFEGWVSTLAGYLSSKTKEDKPKRVFDACRGVIKNDSQMALYLLPHIVIHDLLGGTDTDHEVICNEMLAVLQHAEGQDTRHGCASDLRHICAQTVFTLLDHLTKWTRHRVKTLSIKAASSRSARSVSTSDLNYSQDDGYRRVRAFLARIPQDILAHASYNCSAYTRSLMHHELFIKSRPSGPIQEDLDLLQKLYMALDEPDGVTGITAIKQTQPTLTEQIVAFESIGQLSDASVCYDHAIRSQPSELSLRHGLLRCRLALGELNSVMELTNGMISQTPSCGRQLNSYRVEAAWRLGQWERLEVYLKHEDKSQSWNVGLSRILLAAKCRDEAAYVRQLQLVRNNLMGPLSAASMEVGSYHRGYEYIVRLHMLNELEQCFLTLMDFPSTSTRGQLSSMGLSSPVGDTTMATPEPAIGFAPLMQQWGSRLKFSQSSFRTQEPILTLRRTVLGLCSAGHNLEKVIGQCWLQTARIARKCSLVQTAQSSLLSACSYKLPEFCIENAKWLWDRGDYDKAQSCLEKSLEEHYPDRTLLRADNSQESRAERHACAKVLLLLGNYCEETASWESNAIMRQYKEVIKVHSDWEDGYFHIAKYYDKIMTNLIESDRPEKKGEFVIQVVQYFGQSLLHGNQYIYQSMPRMLTLWLDYGAEVTETETRSKSEVMVQGMRAVLQHLNKLMSGFCQKLAPYQFLTAFPQLISRICHTHADVFAQLKEITARLLATFPQQAMWLMMAVSKSSFQTRVKRCQEIFGLAKSMNHDLNKFLLDATKLTERLLDVCNKHVDGSSVVLSLSQHFKPLKRLVEDRHFSRVMFPLQSLMAVSLPSADIIPTSHSPFPGTPVYITGVEDTIEVLPSLARPKKITMLGSDGQLYTMLCKPKDDLRKDARLMEFNSIVNRCLHKNPEARRTDLHIRTFTVTPLNEECGLLEWVSHTRGIRPILLQLYKERGIYTTAKELKTMQLPPGAPLQKKLDIYKQKLLPKHPALFSDWFLKTFPDPTACKRMEVMPMVGVDSHGVT